MLPQGFSHAFRIVQVVGLGEKLMFLARTGRHWAIFERATRNCVCCGAMQTEW
jgi:hypothetical protein